MHQNLTLIGVCPKDPKTEERINRALDTLKPDLVTLQYPGDQAPLFSETPAIRALLREGRLTLCRLFEERGVPAPHSFDPFLWKSQELEIQATQRYCEQHGIPLICTESFDLWSKSLPNLLQGKNRDYPAYIPEAIDQMIEENKLDQEKIESMNEEEIQTIISGHFGKRNQEKADHRYGNYSSFLQKQPIVSHSRTKLIELLGGEYDRIDADREAYQAEALRQALSYYTPLRPVHIGRLKHLVEIPWDPKSPWLSLKLRLQGRFSLYERLRGLTKDRFTLGHFDQADPQAGSGK